MKEKGKTDGKYEGELSCSVCEQGTKQCVRESLKERDSTESRKTETGR